MGNKLDLLNTGGNIMNTLLMGLQTMFKQNYIQCQMTPDWNMLLAKHSFNVGEKRIILEIQIMSDAQDNGKLVYLVYNITDKKMMPSSQHERKIRNYNKQIAPYSLIIDRDLYFAMMLETYILDVPASGIHLHCIESAYKKFADLINFIKSEYLQIINVTDSR